jgi:uncharacterized membrane protein
VKVKINSGGDLSLKYIYSIEPHYSVVIIIIIIIIIVIIITIIIIIIINSISMFSLYTVPAGNVAMVRNKANSVPRTSDCQQMLLVVGNAQDGA